MEFQSTRGDAPAVSFGVALRQGLAPDGGLYVPSAWPVQSPTAFASTHTLPDVGARLIAPFTAGDVLEDQLPEITRSAFSFPAPVRPLDADGRYSVLELFHGPTAAFKDFGARFLAACFERLHEPGNAPVNILVATSGDTGGAVAAAFHRRPGLGVTVLFPKGLVSPTQERQLTCWGDNVRSLSVRGTFDDCQQLVKEAFVDPAMRARFALSSANSINLGRLLPQAAYYAAASLDCHRRTGEPLSFVIPAGNLGNAVACIWARRCGLPIGDVVLAHNANTTVPEFLQSGQWQPRPSIATLASAMDVGNPSNMERLRALYPDVAELRRAVRAVSVDDDTIRARISADFAAYGQVWCPHTATAAEAYAQLPAEERAGRHWCIVSTAHPAKFAEIVEPLIGRAVEVPPALAELFSRESHSVEIDATLPALRAAMDA
jgi:threonine synthase